MSECIIGVSHSKFGKLENETVESLIVRVAVDAIADAGLEPHDIDAIFLGTMNAGLCQQEFPASLVLQAHPGLRFKPATRVENACATGSAAVYQGLAAIAARRARFVLVVGVEKMTHLSSAEVGGVLIKASYLAEEGAITGGFVGVFSQITDLYFEKYGNQSNALARIAAKNHSNGARNPFAQVQKDLGYDHCLGGEKNPLVVGHLRRTDCSLVSDGAAALVLTDSETALGMKQAVRFRAAVQVNDYLPMSRRDIIAFEGATIAWQQALEEAGLSLTDLSLVETHDCFTSAELIEYEAMGLTARGRGHEALEAGWTEIGGRLPVNPSGGLKAKGHPVGATGVSMHVLCAMQLMGTAPGFQIPGAKLAGLFNMGGAAVANYVSILEPLR